MPTTMGGAQLGPPNHMEQVPYRIEGLSYYREISLSMGNPVLLALGPILVSS